MQKDIDEVKLYVMENRALQRNENIITFNEFTESHQLILPVKTTEEFKNFDEALVDQCYSDLVSCFKIFI